MFGTTQRRFLAAFCSVATSVFALAAPVGTTFTYQGRLTDANGLSDGNFNMSFKLCSTNSCKDGNVLETIDIANVPVSEGLFTVNLKYAASNFSAGEQRWLEVIVSGTTLCPRQELTATPYAVFSQRPWQTSGANVYYSGGNVGIGDSSPASLLTVGSGDKFQVEGTAGSLSFTDDLASITFPAADSTNSPMIYMFASGTGNGDRMVVAHSPTYKTWGLQYQDSGDKFNFVSNGANVMTVDLGNRSVGIGTSSPSEAFHIDEGNFLLNTANGTLRLMYVAGNDGFRLATGNAGTRLLVQSVTDGTPTNRFSFTDDGLLGIGTTSPSVPLHITNGTDLELASGGFLLNGSASGTNLVLDNNEIQCRNNGAAEKLYLNFEGGDVILNGQGLDNVGIGVSSPSAPLTVYKETGGTAAFLYTNNARVMSVAQYDSTSTVEAVYMYSASNTDPALYVYNTNAPAALIVAGTAQVSVLEVTGADVAERFAASETLEPGTVVMIDKENPGKLCMSRGAYNRCVAGIVSGANGLSAGTILGNLPESKDGPAIALSGRVWVKVDTSSGAIEPGDMLTTSHTPGHAMKVSNFDDAHGAVIGKAMTGLKSGEGMVLVLVNLQ
jgi:hypothetical protein